VDAAVLLFNLNTEEERKKKNSENLYMSEQGYFFVRLNWMI